MLDLDIKMIKEKITSGLYIVIFFPIIKIAELNNNKNKNNDNQ
jgi:hypothetical protein